MSEIPFTLISELASQHNFKLVGAFNSWELAKDGKHLAAWQAKGRAGEMTYMQRNTNLFTDLNNFLPGVKSVISLAVDYSAWPSAETCPSGYARVARYAWGADYHQVLKTAVQSFVSQLQQSCSNNFNHRFFTDAVPLLERAMAKHAGLGFIGKNTLLIRPGTGSFTFLAELLLDCEIKDLPVLTKSQGSCGTCTRCISACPTNAIVQPFELDARKCISYLTIEKRGELNTWESEAIGQWVFGCDICQEVCPFNHTVLKKSPLPFKGFEPLPYIKNGLIDLAFIFSIKDKSEFKKVFGNSAIMRTKRTGLLRNAICVVANSEVLQFIPSLLSILKNDMDLILQKQVLHTLFSLIKKCDSKQISIIKLALDNNLKSANESLSKLTKELLDELQ